MKKISIAILALITVLSSCKKVPEVNLKYVDVERDLITVGTTTATVQCDYQYIATLKKAYFYYGEGQDEADMNTAEMRVVQNTLYVDLVGLKENTTYSYYYEFYNGFNSMRTEAKTFKTEASPIVVTLPTVITAEVNEITENSAQCGGEVTNDGGAEVTERGICWGVNANPTLSDNHIAVGSGLGEFTALMDGLESNMNYYVRAYATNEVGTAYGLDNEFTTKVYVPEGAINGLFTVDSLGHKVYFSQGNLQYQASTNTWRFAENQWDYIGSGNENISPTYDGWIDYFGWGTSGWDNGNLYYQPYSTESHWDPEIGYGYGPTDGTCYTYDLSGTYANADWGVYNPISNGGNMPNHWRTLTMDELSYVLNVRNTQSGIRFAKAVVNGWCLCLIILPNDWDTTVFTLNAPNRLDAPYTTNETTVENWAILETNGAVLLPAAGHRSASAGLYNNYGFYWTASSNGSDGAYYFRFNSNNGPSIWDIPQRYSGYSVRLVQDANK